MLLVNNVSGDYNDNADDAEQSCYRDSLERAQFADKLSRFERLTSWVTDHSPSSRPSSAPLTRSDHHDTPTEQLSHSVSDSAPVITSPVLRGWTRRGHRVGVVETPTGDLDLDATSPPCARLEPATKRRGDEVSQVNADPSVDSWRLCEDTYSCVPTRKSLQPPAKRQISGDRLSDVKAAILASAAAKLSSTTVSSVRSNDISPDSLRASSARCDGLQRSVSVECRTAGRVAGADNCSHDSDEVLKQSDEQSSGSTHSDSSSSHHNTDISPTTQKPPTGRTSAESACSTKHSDQRRSFDKASSFFRSLLSRSRSPSPSQTSPRVGKSARPVELALNGCRTQDQGGSKTAPVSSPSPPGYFTGGGGGVTHSESSSVTSSPDSSASFEHKTLPFSSASSGTDLLYAANNHNKSYSEHSTPLTQCSNSEHYTSLSNSSSKAGSPRGAVTTSIVIASVGQTTVTSFNPPAPVDRNLHLSDDQRLCSTVELVSNAASDSKRELKHSQQQQTSVDVSPRARKVVTFAEERNGDRSVAAVGSRERDSMNGEVHVELNKSTNNNPATISRLIASETVQFTSTTGESDAPQSDVSNANTLQSHSEAVRSNNSVSNIRHDLLQSAADSAWRTDAIAVNGHESNDVSAMEADDSASISDLDSEDLSASQQDLCTLYQRRRTERLQEQQAAELDKQRLEDILKLCTEFGLSSDISPSLVVSADVSDVAEKGTSERQNSVSRIKTNGSLTKLAGLPASTETSSAVEQRRLNHSGSGSNSDDDVDHGTIRRRPVTTKRSVDSSTSKTTFPVSVASDIDKLSRTTLARTGSGSLPTVGLSVEAAGRSKSVPVIDTNMTSSVDGDLERLLQSNVEFSLPTSADWRVGETSNHRAGMVKSSLDWYSASLPEYSSIWDSVNTWKSSQHRVSTTCFLTPLCSARSLTFHHLPAGNRRKHPTIAVVVCTSTQET